MGREINSQASERNMNANSSNNNVVSGIFGIGFLLSLTGVGCNFVAENQRTFYYLSEAAYPETPQQRRSEIYDVFSEGLGFKQFIPFYLVFHNRYESLKSEGFKQH